MPAPATVPELVDMVRKSGLVPADQLDGVLDRHRRAGTPPANPDQLLGQLVRDGLLTFFQAKQLKIGRYKRFTIGAKYRLLELIGTGGMGAVYLCEHTLMKRLVALKVLPVEKLDDQASMERFYREARAVAALNHPNIVRAHDIDQFEKLHFLVMEYVDGTSLQEIVGRHGPMNPVRAAHYIAQAAIGLQHAHELGMVHRDVKPGNLLLERTGLIKVLDMGLARFFNKTNDNVTEKYNENCVLGTADYLAPEQAVTSNVDVRADIYSLGGTFYYLLTGQVPFPDGTIAAKLVSHQTRDPKPVEQYRRDVPPGILAVLRKMMMKNPAKRYAEPIEVAEALAEWVEEATDPPPAHEMPTLCPAVLALTGHSAGQVAPGASQPLRGLATGGRSGLTRLSGGSGERTLPKSGELRKSGERRAAPKSGSQAQVSTGRNSAAETSPLPARADTPGFRGTPVPVPKQPPAAAPAPAAPPNWKRLAVYGLLAGLVFAGGVAATLLALMAAGVLRFA